MSVKPKVELIFTVAPINIKYLDNSERYDVGLSRVQIKIYFLSFGTVTLDLG